MRFDGATLPEESLEQMPAWRGVTPPLKEGSGAAAWLRDRIAADDLPTEPEGDYDRALLAEGRRFADAWLYGKPSTEPRGAAVVGLLGGEHEAPEFAEAWVERLGVVFATRAVVEMAGLIFRPDDRERSFYRRSLDPAARGDWGWDNPECRRMAQDEGRLFRAAKAVRARLAAADDDTFAQAASAVRGDRDGTLPQRLIVSFLFPGHDDWVAADIEAVPGIYREFARVGGLLQTLPLYSAGTADLFRRYATVMQEHDFDLRSWWVNSLGLFGTIVAALGYDAVPILTHPFYKREYENDQFRARDKYSYDGLAFIARFPTDDAVRFVLRSTLYERQDDIHKYGLLTNDPARTLRLLAEGIPTPTVDTAPLAPDVIAMMVLGRPELLDLLPAPDRARVEAIVGDGTSAGRDLAGMLDLYDLYNNRRHVCHTTADRKRAITWIAALPTDEALTLLAERADRKHFRPAVQAIALREPVRALRVLAACEPERPPAREAVNEMLRQHVLTHPDVAVASLSELPPASRARVEALLGGAAERVEELPESSVPAALQAPAKPKTPPTWVVLPALPAIVLRGDDRALPEIAVRRLLMLLSRSTFTKPQPALAEVKAACDPASLAAFAWASFEQWRAADHPAGDKHALLALALLGDDTTVPAVSALFPAWALDAAARVKSGLEVLGAIGTDLALTHLQRVARTAKQKGFRKQAEQKLQQIAEARGLSAAELADRLVPDLGLDAHGRKLLDYGPRQFVITFDERLQPLASDTTGNRLRGLPRPTAAEADAATAAKQAYAALKKDARYFATERLRALEEAMLTGRAWTLPELRTFIVEHPLVRSAARTLLWQVVEGPAFRIAEDHTFADAADETLTPAPDARIRLFHPALAEAEGANWAETFADYEIIQPFPQLSREVHHLTAAQAQARELTDLTGAKAQSRTLFALTARGWRFGEGGASVEREWPSGHTTSITFWPEHNPMWSDADELRTLGAATISEGSFGDLDPVAASEVLRELHRLATPA